MASASGTSGSRDGRLGATTVGYVLVGLIVIAAILESVFAVCLGCVVFGGLMRVGIIPDEVCERCNDIWASSPRPATVPGS